MAETADETPPALASVVQLRLRDYPRRPVAEQARLSAQLDAVLAVLLHDIPAHERIVLEGSGSAAVAVLGNPRAALNFAERALHANDAGIALSIGIDHGAVEMISDESGSALTGDGLATASVTATFAADFGLLVSRNFRAALAEAMPGAEKALVPTGRFSDAGLRSYQVFRVDREAPARRCRRFKLIAVVSAFVLLAAAIGVRLGIPERPRPLARYVDNVNFPAFDRLLEFDRAGP